jgi:hypothetical protein
MMLTDAIIIPMKLKSDEQSGVKNPPALDFVRLIGLDRMKNSNDVIWMVHSLNDDSLLRFTEVCSGYDEDVRRVVAQAIARNTDADDFEQLVNYHVEAAPALAPFMNHPKHRFTDQRHADFQIGEWAEIAYRHFNEDTPYPHHRSLIRGHALICYITGPSAPRDAACSNRELLEWIGSHAIELGEQYDTLEERKIWDKEFLEQLLNAPAKSLQEGLL